MPTATGFKFKSLFPYCAAPDGGGTYNGDWGLDPVMKLFWSQYNLTITTTGQVDFTRADSTTGSTTGNGSVVLSPFALTGDWAAMGKSSRLLGNSSLSGGSHTAVDGETSLQPRSRVCTPYIPIKLALEGNDDPLDDTDAFVYFSATDPGAPGGNYGFKANFDIEFFPNNCVSLLFADAARAGYTTIATGSAGLTDILIFSWWVGYQLPSGWTLNGLSGGTLTTSYSFWSY